MTSSQYGPYAQGCTRATMAGLVTAHQLRRRECVPGPCTHRPSHHESRLHPKSGSGQPKVWVVIGMKS